MARLQFGMAVRDITPRYPVWAHGYSAHRVLARRGQLQILSRLSVLRTANHFRKMALPGAVHTGRRRRRRAGHGRPGA